MKNINAKNISFFITTLKTKERIKILNYLQEIKRKLPAKNLFINSFLKFSKDTLKLSLSEKIFEKINDNFLKYEDLEINSISFLSEHYPENLLQISDFPPLLFYKGNINLLKDPKKLSIIGARKADLEGNNNAYSFAKDFANLNIPIVSGLAYGIDSSAHKGALASNNPSKTIAILGNGLSSIYPKLHTKLAKTIINSNGLVLSQFEPYSKPLKHNFLNRNRVIASLSELTLVIQANRKSGSLVTARYAFDYGKGVAAIPGSINNPLYGGCNKLIKEAAYLIESTEDLKSILGIDYSHKETSVGTENDCEIIKFLRKKLSFSFQEIQNEFRGDENLLSNLLELEINGKLIRLPGGEYGVKAC